MGTRCRAGVIVGVLGCLTAPAHADPRADIAAKTRAAMASYDAMDYDAARRLLNQALAIAKRARLDKDPLVARVYLDLGIAQLAGSDQEAAKVAFLSAAQIDPKIAIEAAYRSPELVKLLDEARAASGGPAEPASEVTGSAANETEDPINRDVSAGVTAGAARGGMAPRIVIGVSGGTGIGYVTGTTEDNNPVQKCCIGSSLVVLASELAYRATPRLSIGVAARLGFPLGATVMGHSKVAPAGFVRMRYAVTSFGLRVMAEAGGGITRNTIKLDGMAGVETDVVAQGPLLLGAGVGYTRPLAGHLALVIDLDAIAGIAVVDNLGTAVHLNTGVSADLSVGLAFGF